MGRPDPNWTLFRIGITNWPSRETSHGPNEADRRIAGQFGIETERFVAYPAGENSWYIFIHKDLLR